MTKALQDYKLAKKKANVWRNKFLDSLVEACAKNFGTTTEAEERLLKEIEQQQASNVKQIRRKKRTVK